MRTLTPAELLSVWERGYGQRPPERALTLLAVARPDAAPEELLCLSVGRRDAAILDLRESNFGSRFSGVTKCPACGEQVEVQFTSEHVRAQASADYAPADHASTLTAAAGDRTIHFRLPDSSDLLAVADAPHDARSILLSRCLLDGDIDEETTAVVLARMAAADPQANVQLAISCPTCQSVFERPFDVVAWLWSELSSWATRVVREVHLLAGAYGWRESEILSMTPWRRQLYLELVQ
jgi:hypothetical protein